MDFLQADLLDAPGTYTGNGDSVLLLLSDSPDTATITGNAASRHFAVIGYANRKNLLVNTTDAYSGTVILDKDTFMFEIKAVGEWTISVTEK